MKPAGDVPAGAYGEMPKMPCDTACRSDAECGMELLWRCKDNKLDENLPSESLV
jgi:hypothetical protein